MSLVVARQLSQEIRIISDTKMMSYNALRQTPIDGGLKCIVLSPCRCVSFVGNASIAENALAPIISGQIMSREEITSCLLACHLDMGGETDFLVCETGKGIHIDRIADGLLEKDLSTAWIGDANAFARYQASYHLESKTQAIEIEDRFELASRMSAAFRAVIADPIISSVDHFAITVTSHPAQEDGFRYLPNAAGSGFEAISLTNEPTSLLQTLGAEGGSYNYSVLVPLSAGIGAVAVYIREARLGALFFPAHSWRAIRFVGLSINEFIDAVQEQYGISVDGVRI